jgi:hypothetical protein
MTPYFSFNPLNKYYNFMPGPEIFFNSNLLIETRNATTFYDIFDGYYHVTLKFNITV